MSRITSVLHVCPNQYAFLTKSTKYMAESMQIDFLCLKVTSTKRMCMQMNKAEGQVLNLLKPVNAKF